MGPDAMILVIRCLQRHASSRPTNQPICCHMTSALCCPGAPLSMPTPYKSVFAAANHEMPVPMLRVLPLYASKATAFLEW